MTEPSPRLVTLVLCTPTGEVLGSLPRFQAEPPWWQDAAGLVSRVHEQYGITVTILRLLDAARPAPPGGEVTYLAEVAERPDGLPGLASWPGALEPDPLRLPYAEPGGPARDLVWAEEVLATLGISRQGAAQQVRTWNLSSLWRIPVDEGNVWLKCVPPFFAHEGVVLDALRAAPVPRLLARDDGRVLMPEIPGEDLYGASLPTLLDLVSMLVDLQAQWFGQEQRLLALGMPDWRSAALTDAIEVVVRRNGSQLDQTGRNTLDEFVAALPQRFAALEPCGIPETLVHGDFAPGNARGDGHSLVLLDWGDCGVGHPLLDQAAFVDRISPAFVPEVRKHWDDAWRRAVPGSDPRRASDLLAPVAAARQAVIYQGFLDRIEASEHPYHRGDPAEWLTRTAAIVRSAD